MSAAICNLPTICQLRQISRTLRPPVASLPALEGLIIIHSKILASAISKWSFRVESWCPVLLGWCLCKWIILDPPRLPLLNYHGTRGQQQKHFNCNYFQIELHTCGRPAPFGVPCGEYHFTRHSISLTPPGCVCLSVWSTVCIWSTSSLTALCLTLRCSPNSYWERKHIDTSQYKITKRFFFFKL